MNIASYLNKASHNARGVPCHGMECIMKKKISLETTYINMPNKTFYRTSKNSHNVSSISVCFSDNITLSLTFRLAP